jgi:hypothetical protein
MVLRYHRRNVTFDEVRAAIYGTDEPGEYDALQIVDAFSSFRLRCQGVLVEGWPPPKRPPKLTTPCLAHMSVEPGPFPWDSAVGGEQPEKYFGVVDRLETHRVSVISPSIGPVQFRADQFLKFSTGIFLIFEESTDIPRMRTTRYGRAT